MDFAPRGRPSWTSTRLVAAVGLPLLINACGRSPTSGVPVPAPSASAATVGHDAARAPQDASPVIKDGGKSADAAVDLAADVAARAREAHERFGANARLRTVDGTFVMVEAGRSGPLFDQAVMLLERALPPLFHDRFTRHPTAGVSILLFSSAPEYDAFCEEHYGVGAKSNFGLYRRSSRDIVVDISGGAAFLPTLSHEVVHPIIEADFPRAPVWIDEGIASLFEAPFFTKDGGIHGVARNWRHARLLSAFASKTEREAARLDALFGMSTRDFLGIPREGHVRDADESVRNLHYATARSVAAWLDEQGRLWPFYRAWRDGVADDPTGEKAFERVMGAPAAAMNAAWVKWAR
jgi:hypothetical protein